MKAKFDYFAQYKLFILSLLEYSRSISKVIRLSTFAFTKCKQIEKDQEKILLVSKFENFRFFKSLLIFFKTYHSHYFLDKKLSLLYRLILYYRNQVCLRHGLQKRYHTKRSLRSIRIPRLAKIPII